MPSASAPDLASLDHQIEGIVALLGDRPDEQLARFREQVAAVLAATDPTVLAEALQRFASTGATWGYHPPHPLARQLHHALAELALLPGSSLLGTEHLATALAGPVTFVANHASYADANLFEILLARSGFESIAARLTVLAGPKVYSAPFRRLSSLCFGTIKTPQSSTRASGEALMSARDVARLARDSIRVADERRRAGDHLLLFVEGSRSRSGAMQHALAAVSRYLDQPGTVLVPLGIAGSAAVVGLGDERLRAAVVTLRVGRPLSGHLLAQRCAGRRQLMMDALGVRIAQLLPEAYRGVYAPPEGGHEEAFSVAGSLL